MKSTKNFIYQSLLVLVTVLVLPNKIISIASPAKIADPMQLSQWTAKPTFTLTHLIGEGIWTPALFQKNSLLHCTGKFSCFNYNDFDNSSIMLSAGIGYRHLMRYDAMLGGYFLLNTYEPRAFMLQHTRQSCLDIVLEGATPTFHHAASLHVPFWDMDLKFITQSIRSSQENTAGSYSVHSLTKDNIGFSYQLTYLNLMTIGLTPLVKLQALYFKPTKKTFYNVIFGIEYHTDHWDLRVAYHKTNLEEHLPWEIKLSFKPFKSLHAVKQHKLLSLPTTQNNDLFSPHYTIRAKNSAEKESTSSRSKSRNRSRNTHSASRSSSLHRKQNVSPNREGIHSKHSDADLQRVDSGYNADPSTQSTYQTGSLKPNISDTLNVKKQRVRVSPTRKKEDNFGKNEAQTNHKESTSKDLDITQTNIQSDTLSSGTTPFQNKTAPKGKPEQSFSHSNDSTRHIPKTSKPRASVASTPQEFSNSSKTRKISGKSKISQKTTYRSGRYNEQPTTAIPQTVLPDASTKDAAPSSMHTNDTIEQPSSNNNVYTSSYKDTQEERRVFIEALENLKGYRIDIQKHIDTAKQWDALISKNRNPALQKKLGTYLNKLTAWKTYCQNETDPLQFSKHEDTIEALLEECSPLHKEIETQLHKGQSNNFSGNSSVKDTYQQTYTRRFDAVNYSSWSHSDADYTSSNYHSYKSPTTYVSSTTASPMTTDDAFLRKYITEDIHSLSRMNTEERHQFCAKKLNEICYPQSEEERAAKEQLFKKLVKICKKYLFIDLVPSENAEFIEYHTKKSIYDLYFTGAEALHQFLRTTLWTKFYPDQNLSPEKKNVAIQLFKKLARIFETDFRLDHPGSFEDAIYMEQHTDTSMHQLYIMNPKERLKFRRKKIFLEFHPDRCQNPEEKLERTEIFSKLDKFYLENFNGDGTLKGFDEMDSESEQCDNS